MISEMVYPDLVFLDLNVNDTNELFEVVDRRLRKKGFVTEDFLPSIKSREQEYPTALPTRPYSVAIPHTDPRHIKKPFVSAIRLEHPIPWQEMADNEVTHDVQLVFMLGFNEAGAGSHIELLQLLVDNMQKEECVGRLLRAGGPEEYFQAVMAMEGMEN